MSANINTTIITPNKSFQHFWSELWDYRDLFFYLAWRDFKVRYKQTALGVVWAFLRPLFTMVVFTIVFGKIAKLPDGGVPYPLLVFAAMLPWYFFASSFQESSNALINNANMISKVYFPRIIMPVSTLFVNLVDFLISLGILLLLMVWYQFVPSANCIWFPFLLLLAAMTAVGAGLWMSAFNVSFRDFRYVVPFIVQLGLYVSPVGFSTHVVTGSWRLLYSLNPMVA